MRLTPIVRVVFLAVQPISAETLSQKDMAFAFSLPAISGDLGEIALLSNQEMMETEGEWGFLRYIPNVWSHIRTFRIKGHYDIKPHRFSNYWGPLRGNRAHYQLTFYRRGVSDSH